MPLPNRSYLRLRRLLQRSSVSISLSRCLATTPIDDHFPVLNGFVDTVSRHYADTYRRNLALSTEVQEHKAKAKAGGGERAIKRHTELNKKLLVRERLRLLLDQPEGDNFLEIAPLAGCVGLEYGDVPSAGVVAGIGVIRGRRCVVMANDATVKGGTVYPITVKKQLRGQEIAEMLRMPCIYVVDSGGAFLPLQVRVYRFLEAATRRDPYRSCFFSGRLRGCGIGTLTRLTYCFQMDNYNCLFQRDIFPDKNHGGRVFRNEAVMGSMGIAQIAVVCGSCTAGAAYIPTMADDAVIVDRIGSVFLGGPPLVRAALGEVVSSEELGGATLHCRYIYWRSDGSYRGLELWVVYRIHTAIESRFRTSGCTDYFAEDEPTAFAMCRDIVESLSDESSVFSTQPSRLPIEEPRFSPFELPGIDGDGDVFVYRLLSRVLDGSRFREFRNGYGTSLTVGFGRLGGRLIGVVAANGSMIDERSAQKACQLVQMCDNRRLPIVFFQNTRHDGWSQNENTTESARTLKAVAALMSAVATSNSWKITVSVGDSFGSDYFALVSNLFGPDDRRACIWIPVTLAQPVGTCAIA